MQAGKIYMRRFIVVMSGYMVLLFASQSILDQLAADNALRYVVAVLPVLPLIYGVFAVLRYLITIDELQRQIQLEGFAFSVGVTGIITMTLGFLETAGIEPFGMIWVFPMLMMFWGVGVFLSKRRYS